MLEVMFVVVIIATLALFALQSYQKSISQSRKKNAISNMEVIQKAEKIYRIKNGSYTGSLGNLEEINASLNLNIQDNYFNYEVNAEGNTFFIVCRSKDGKITITMDEEGEVSVSE